MPVDPIPRAAPVGRTPEAVPEEGVRERRLQRENKRRPRRQKKQRDAEERLAPASAVGEHLDVSA
ncbi:MAG: hypothetical protein JXA57_03520 [Armatimonadetes bacterium]|nr:hypothetical protein [Armatimonadota bacterium]